MLSRIVQSSHRMGAFIRGSRLINKQICRPLSFLQRDSIHHQSPTFIVFPEINEELTVNNKFRKVVTNGQIPIIDITPKDLVEACGIASVEFEHFIDETSANLNREFADQEVSNARLNELIIELEKHLAPFNYSIALLRAFRFIDRPKYNFEKLDLFLSKRFLKAKLRFLNRQIYCFMCEMKQRRELTENSQDEKKISESTADISFEQSQKNQLVDRYIREARELGQGLKSQEQTNVFSMINQKIHTEEIYFLNAIVNGNSHFQSNIVSPQFLDCLPDHVITNLNHTDANSVFDSFMRYCPDQNLRKDFWLSFNKRGALEGNNKGNDLRRIEVIREYRHRKAILLGFKNFAQMSLELRGSGGQTMAGTIDNVRAFIQGLNARSEDRFTTNLKELEDFATIKPKGSQTTVPKHKVEQINLWDLEYFKRLYLREHYQVDSRDIRAHFPLDRVVSGMLRFAENLFGIKIVEQKDENQKPIGWNDHSSSYKVFSNNSKSMAELGTFYLDPFVEDGSVTFPVSRCESMGTKPIAFLLCDFNKGGSIFDRYEDNQKLHAPEEATLLNFVDVLELFGRFGMVLQHLLTEVKYIEVNSTHNLEADSYHLIYYFMRYWALNSYDAIKQCSGHFKTGEPVTKDFFHRISQAHNHFSALSLKNELHYMALDIDLHSSRDHTSKIQKKVWKEIMGPFELLQENKYLTSASQIFAFTPGIVYAKKWSEVIAADIFDAFRADTETGLKSDEQIKQLGQRFRETFLAQSGAYSTNDLFRRFRGRDPTLDAFLSINRLE